MVSSSLKYFVTIERSFNVIAKCWCILQITRLVICQFIRYIINTMFMVVKKGMKVILSGGTAPPTKN